MLKSTQEQIFLQKKEQIAKLQEFKNLSGKMVHQLEQVAEMIDTMSDGAENAALMLDNWQHVIKSISLASVSVLNFADPEYKPDTSLPDVVVRVRANEAEGEQIEEA